ncbi:MAG: mannose-1-phosphate guanylyltransferase/mannose-6-phosphate isomerase [Methanofollis sp.]|uniref:mannose-1-phosphate guanylyltransferase/mannose-6-phosphate isomerase n=1 Tax=Methanofollis sp. TaxID=2052835 RepID=UPI002610B88A|nr:mannose-1-phosphate guanylyltransferase/mannose-6-phosphate isomerase [Methanofollis sp.]MDD4255875.1 mannose-1-phosphate guanylyltransferase/mannose-6-phosphate isomerase [Methanofollis sp.]
MKTIILAGGSGTRLFPLSRTCYPKQFIPLLGKESLFQRTVRRALLFSRPEEIYVITSSAHRFLVADQLTEIGAPCRVLTEPEGKNTLPAIACGMTAILGECGDDTVAVLSSDQLIEAGDAYKAAFLAAEALAEDHLVTFGIAPTSPHTGFGYIHPGEPLPGGYAVEAFVEKPDLETAERYVKEGYLWNSGMFLFRAALFMEECRRLAPEVADAFALPAEEAYAKTPKISVDYGIMERTDRAAVVPLACSWSDVGSFDALYCLSEKDDAGNAIRGEYIGIEGRDNLIISDRLVATIGLSDLAVVDTPDALLICPKGEAQRVGEVTALLKERGDERCDLHTTVHRPWGSYTVLLKGDSFQIKRLTVLPGRRISAQLHHHRSEHWVVVRGMARVSNNGDSFFVRPGESTFVPAGTKHRLENPGLIPLEVIEVQNGEYITEEDIVRFDDDFRRE